MKCPECGFNNHDWVRVCQKCSYALPSPAAVVSSHEKSPTSNDSATRRWTASLGNVFFGKESNKPKPGSKEAKERVDQIFDQIGGTGGMTKLSRNRDITHERMKFDLVEAAHQQARNRGHSIPDEAMLFAKAIMLDKLPPSTFTQNTAGKSCPKAVLNSILKLLDSYPCELAALIARRHIPPPMGIWFMLTLREMRDISKDYIDKAARVIANSLCWAPNFETAHKAFSEIPDVKMREKVGEYMLEMAIRVGWRSKDPFITL